MLDKSKKTVCVLGLGQIGFPVAKHVEQTGNCRVVGYDINPKTVEHARGNGISATTEWHQLPVNADVYMVCVATNWNKERNCEDQSAIFTVCENISLTANENTLVTIESTIVPGTCQTLFEDVFNKKIQLAHVPHRYWAEQEDMYGVNQPRVLGAVNPESMKTAINFYKSTLGIPVTPLTNAKMAEMCKIVENSHRYLQIAFAEELKIACDKVNIDFAELRIAMNTKWNVDMLEAKEGIGGHCLPKDLEYVQQFIPLKLFDTAKQIDKEYRQYIIKK